MFNGILAIIFIIVGISIGIVYNKFVIKDYPDYKRRFGYFITIVIFIALSLVIYVIISIKSGINSTINEYSVKLEQYVNYNYPENDFVKNGLDLKEINNDISKINKSVDDLKSILPNHRELGVNKTFYYLLSNYAIKELQKRLTVINYSAKMINTFSDKNNVLTVSSVTNGLRINIIKLVNTISLIIVSIFILMVIIYIIFTLNIVRREKKFRKI